MSAHRSFRLTPSSAQAVTARVGMVFPILQQVMFLFFGAGVLDGGRCLQVVGYAVLAYWAGFGLVMIRRSRQLTKVDTVFIRVGFLMLVPASTLVTQVIWRWQGHY